MFFTRNRNTGQLLLAKILKSGNYRFDLQECWCQWRAHLDVHIIFTFDANHIRERDSLTMKMNECKMVERIIYISTSPTLVRFHPFVLRKKTTCHLMLICCYLFLFHERLDFISKTFNHINIYIRKNGLEGCDHNSQCVQLMFDPSQMFGNICVNIWLACLAIKCPRQNANHGSSTVLPNNQRATRIGRAYAIVNCISCANLLSTQFGNIPADSL